MGSPASSTLRKQRLSSGWSEMRAMEGEFRINDLTTATATGAPAVVLAARQAVAMRAPSSTTTALGQELCLVHVRSLSRRVRCAPSTRHPFG